MPFCWPEHEDDRLLFFFFDRVIMERHDLPGTAVLPSRLHWRLTMTPPRGQKLPEEVKVKSARVRHWECFLEVPSSRRQAPSAIAKRTITKVSGT
jgi:hypothetical protein